MLQDSDKDSLLADIVEQFANKGSQGQALKFAEAIADLELKAKKRSPKLLTLLARKGSAQRLPLLTTYKLRRCAVSAFFITWNM